MQSKQSYINEDRDRSATRRPVDAPVSVDRSVSDRVVSVPWQPQPKPADTVNIKPTIDYSKEDNRPVNATIPSSHNAHKDQWEAATEDDTSSRSSTLDGNDDYMETVDKRTIPLSKLLASREVRAEGPGSPAPAPHVPGPLESQLAALMSKLIYIEHANPTVSVSPEEHEELRKRLEVLEEEKKQWWKRHDAIWALRDEDVENNIKIRVSTDH